MDAAGAARRRRCSRIAGSRRLDNLPEPGADRRERAHEAARPQQLAPRPAACGQKPVQPLLLHLVHVLEPIRRPLIDCTVLDVLAENSGALLVAATEEPAAIVL